MIKPKINQPVFHFFSCVPKFQHAFLAIPFSHIKLISVIWVSRLPPSFLRILDLRKLSLSHSLSLASFQPLLTISTKLWCHRSLHIRSQNVGWSWWDRGRLTVIRRCFWSLVSTGPVSTNWPKSGIYPSTAETTSVWPDFKLVWNQSVSLPKR